MYLFVADISASPGSDSFDAAKAVLQQLHDSAFRCMMDGVSLNLGQGDGNVSVSGNIVFFEYRKGSSTAQTS